MPGPTAVMVAWPLASSKPPARTEMVAVPGGMEAGTMKFTFDVVPPTNCAAMPFTVT